MNKVHQTNDASALLDRTPLSLSCITIDYSPLIYLFFLYVHTIPVVPVLSRRLLLPSLIFLKIVLNCFSGLRSEF
jgi:hypothetical protein